MGVPTLKDKETITALYNNMLRGESPYKDYWIKQLRINDEITHLNRLIWNFIPPEIKGRDIERVLYYRKRGAFFYITPLKKWAFLPYTTEGAVDYLGRYEYFRPLPFTGAEEGKNEKDKMKNIVLADIKRKPCYEMPDGSMDPVEWANTYCVPVEDYCLQLSQTGIPRARLSEGIIDLESNIPCYVNSLLKNSTGTVGLRVSGDDEQRNVEQADDAVERAALNGRKFVGVNGTMELQELGVQGGRVGAEDFMLVWESLDNVRIGMLGVGNGGIFEKKQQALNAEIGGNNFNTSLIMEDALELRQFACDCLYMGYLAPLGVPPEFAPNCTARIPQSFGIGLLDNQSDSYGEGSDSDSKSNGNNLSNNNINNNNSGGNEDD